MIYLALALGVLALVYSGRRAAWQVGAGLRKGFAVWRPTAGLASAALLVIAMVLAVREDWLPALGVATAGVVSALGARRRLRRAPAPAASMSEREACAVLGVARGASAAEVQAAYRRLAARVHPDQGGTGGLAAQLNAARDTLLGRKAR